MLSSTPGRDQAGSDPRERDEEFKEFKEFKLFKLFKVFKLFKLFENVCNTRNNIIYNDSNICVCRGRVKAV